MPQHLGVNRMSHERYQRLQAVWICPSAVEELNKAAENVILLGETLSIDEKLKGFTGESLYLCYVPNKDPCNGHWITKATCKEEKTGMPFLLHAIPVQQSEGPTMLEFYKECLKNIPRVQRQQLVVITDAYYMDDASRTWLHQKGFKYLAAINPRRFKEVWCPLLLQVKHIKDTAVAWNPQTQEVAALYWALEGKKFYILSNAWKYKTTEDQLNSASLFLTYKHLFNTCDCLNHFIANKGYPYDRPGWQYNFDDFHFSTILWNIYMVYHEVHSLEQRLEWESFLFELVKQLSQ